jgi:methylated-DNA-[protein]-cysteine S-methyltransferase
LPILVPCHRVIGKNGKLVGYSGSSEEGLKIKEQLLVIENPTLQEITLF